MLYSIAISKASVTYVKQKEPSPLLYGYGWLIPEKYKECVCHSGYVLGFTANFYRFMEHKATIVILANEGDVYGFNKISEGLVNIAEEYKLMTKVETDK